MTRPQARKSSLAGSTPLRATEASVEKTNVTKKWRHKVSFYQDPAETDRVRGAILHTMVTEGNRNLSQFINRALMAEVKRLEDKYNDGQPFPSVTAGQLPQGGAAAAHDTTLGEAEN